MRLRSAASHGYGGAACGGPARVGAGPKPRRVPEQLGQRHGGWRLDRWTWRDTLWVSSQKIGYYFGVGQFFDQKHRLLRWYVPGRTADS
ncbi:hypothetical protein [Microtetraspora malaysiensis]|uniref:Uncharacterized protein n=1 Tax=Microtetraspora malaysiensis TaxID=161358 RepID=A0ABW6SS55_9ACTN